MAKILLNVEINEGTYKQQLAELKKQVDSVFSSSNSGVKGNDGIKATLQSVESLQKSFANLLNTLKGSKGKYGADTFKELETSIGECLEKSKELTKEWSKKTEQEKVDEIKKLRSEYSKLSTDFSTIKAERRETAEAENKWAKEAEKAAQQAEKAAQQEAKAREKAAQQAIAQNQREKNDIDRLQSSYASLITNIQNIEKYYKKGTFASQSAEAKQLLAELQELSIAYKTNGSLNKQQSQRLAEVKTRLGELTAETKTAQATNKNYHGSLLEIIQGFAKFNLAATVVMKTINLLRGAWNSVNETLVKTEDAVIALQRVAGEAANADELYDLAQRYGQTFENVNEIALNFARSGMDWTDTIKATESALLALNVAELDATQASDGMIAIMTQFGIKAENLTEVVDKLNITADNAAVSTDKLLTALQRTGSSAVNANLSLEETVGLITALSEATGRSGENLGTAINSLIQFSTKDTALDTFAELGGDVEKTVEAYRKGSATVLDIWRELSNVVGNANAENEGILGGLFGDSDWQSLNQELQDALGENFATVNEIYGTASTFRKNYFIALLNNLDQVDESLAKMNEANGYSQAENEQYLDTYTAKVNALQAKWQDIANDENGLLGVRKLLVDIASGLLTATKYVGGLRTVFIALSTVVAMVFGTKIIIGIKNFITLITSATTAVKGFNAVLGIVGTIATAISLIKGINDSNNTAKLEKQAESIESGAENLSTLGDELEEINKKYDNLEKTIRDYRAVLADESSGQDKVAEAEKGLLSIQKDLLESNKDYKDGLDLINGALDDQIEKTKKLDESARFEERKNLINEYLNDTESAYRNANKYLEKTSSTITFKGDKKEIETLRKWLNDTAHLNTSLSASRVGEVSLFAGAMTKDKQITFLEELKELADKEEDAETRSILIAAISDAKTKITSDSAYQNSRDVVYGDKDSKELYKQASREQLIQLKEAGNIGIDEFNRVWNEIFPSSIGNSGSNGAPDIVNTLEELNDTLKDKILTELEALRSTEEKSNALEEKRQALENAKNQRTVRVFNAETGQWEQVANQKDIQKAEENYKDEAYSQIKDLFNNKDDLSNESMAELLATIAETMPEIRDDVYKLLKDEFGIELPAYDSGGVLSGLGGIKATTRDEIVLPPNIAEKILQPTSNEQFRNFTKSLGILFGASERVGTMSPNSVIHNRGGDTINSNNGGNNTYINGVPITQQQAERYSVVELLETLPLTNNN